MFTLRSFQLLTENKMRLFDEINRQIVPKADVNPRYRLDSIHQSVQSLIHRDSLGEPSLVYLKQPDINGQISIALLHQLRCHNHDFWLAHILFELEFELEPSSCPWTPIPIDLMRFRGRHRADRV